MTTANQKEDHDQSSVYNRALALTVIVSLLGIASAAALFVRTEQATGMHPDDFWETKLSWRHEADCVLIGDSRTYVSVSPDALARGMGEDVRVYNYGFSANGLTDEYLSTIERIIDPKSQSKCIIVGMTTVSLLGASEHFNKESKKPRTPALVPRSWLLPFERVQFSDLLASLRDKSKINIHTREYHSNGWAAATLREDAYKETLATIRATLDSKIEQERIDLIARYISKWNQAGIVVYLFRPPTSVEMLELESEWGEYEARNIPTTFIDDGAIWIDVEQTKYHSYDASHLSRNAAEEFSQDLGELIKATRD